jgi:dephospho-CoA kinase
VFGDTDARTRLNAIVHPRIGQLSVERIAAAQRSSTPYIVYEAPLLVETGAYRGLAALVVVATAPEAQLARVVSRDGLTIDAARARLAAQTPLHAKLAVATYVINNDEGARKRNKPRFAWSWLKIGSAGRGKSDLTERRASSLS